MRKKLVDVLGDAMGYIGGWALMAKRAVLRQQGSKNNPIPVPPIEIAPYTHNCIKAWGNLSERDRAMEVVKLATMLEVLLHRHDPTILRKEIGGQDATMH